jgi:diguanylate cyclase (GGDEF)-like protein
LSVAGHSYGQRLVDDARPVAAAWIERVRATGGTGFSHRTGEERLPFCQAYINTLGRYLVSRDDGVLREVAGKEAVTRFQTGLPLDDLVAAYRWLQDLLWERTGREGAGEGGAVAGLWDLSGAIALCIEETVKAYQGLLSRQVAAQHGAVEALTRQLQQSATIDELTGLFTARVFHEHLPREIHRAERYHRPVSLVVFDVDEFARLVDLCGTEEADRVLQELARVVPGRVREVDIMCRLDVDEFAVILPETPALLALPVAERIRDAAEGHGGFADAVRASGPVRITAGVAGYPDDAPAAAELEARAREACQHAKRLGKNQVLPFSESRVP